MKHKKSSTFVETANSPLNNSRFKQLYSFPKANRFVSQSLKPNTPYYDNKVSALGKRSTSFGYGNKLTLENRNPYPPPNSYEKVGVFDYSIKKKKGYSFSIDQDRSIINEDRASLVPGPGKYNYKPDKNDFKRVSYSIRGKYQDPSMRHQNSLGPGQYPTIAALNQTGNYYLAKFPSSGAAKIGRTKRFEQIKTLAPGPGKYEDTKVTGLNNSGTYFCSTFKTNKAATFAHSVRRGIADPSFTPGPGAYNRFSDFSQSRLAMMGGKS